MTIRLVKFHFIAPVHFGEGRLSDSAYACAADTLFSALFIEALGQGSSDSLLDAARSGELLLSDAFPFIGETLYLPKPYAAPQADAAAQEDSGDSTQKKAAKKLKYLPRERFDDYFAGTLDAAKLAAEFRDGLGAGGVATKVSLQREKPEDDPRPYQVGGFRFNDDVGLYFLVRGSYDIEPLLNTLQYSGLGGKRSSGYGRFTYELCAMPEGFLRLPLPQPPRHSERSEAKPSEVEESRTNEGDPSIPPLRGSTQDDKGEMLRSSTLNYEKVTTPVILSGAGGVADREVEGSPTPQAGHMLLSTAAPTQGELIDELLQSASYALRRRSGFVHSGSYAANPLKKRDLYAFAAGSVFTQRFKGDVFDVSCGGAHPVWRYSRAFWAEG